MAPAPLRSSRARRAASPGGGQPWACSRVEEEIALARGLGQWQLFIATLPREFGGFSENRLESGCGRRAEGPAWRTPGGVVCRRRAAVAHTWAARRAPCAGTWFRWHLVTAARGLRCRPARTVAWAGRERGPGAAAFVVLPAACGGDAGATLAAWAALGWEALPRAGAGPPGRPGARPVPVLGRRLPVPAVARRSSSAARRLRGAGPARGAQRASPVPGVFAVLGTGARRRLPGLDAGFSSLRRRMGTPEAVSGAGCSVGRLSEPIAFGETSQVWWRKGVCST